MKVYVTFFRYDRGEEYSIYNIDTSLQRSLKSWYEKDVPSFLGYGPDDVSQLYLVRCHLTVSEVETLKNSMKSSTGYDRGFRDLMDTIYDIGEEICCTTGDEVWEVVEYFYKYFRRFIDPHQYMTSIPTDEDELKEVLQEILFNDDILWDKVLKCYLNR